MIRAVRVEKGEEEVRQQGVGQEELRADLFPCSAGVKFFVPCATNKQCHLWSVKGVGRLKVTFFAFHISTLGNTENGFII